MKKTTLKKIWNILGWIGCGLMGLALIGMLLLKSSGEYHLYMVRSGSMAPAINTGDFVVTGPANGPVNGGLAPGKVITYVSGPIIPGKPLTLTTLT